MSNGLPVQPSPDSDPRQTGWPCWGCHLPKQRSNQHATWSSCTRCALRLSYVAKTGRQGVHRSVGPDPQVLAAALEELQMIYDEGQINEKVVQGKIMEVQGRGLVTTAQGTTSTHVKASQKLGKLLMAPKARPMPTSRRVASEPPTVTTSWEEPESPESMSRSDMGGWTEMTGEEVLRAALPKSMAKAKAKPAAERPEQVAWEWGWARCGNLSRRFGVVLAPLGIVMANTTTAPRLTLRTPLLKMSHDTSPRMGLWMLKMEDLMDFILWRSMWRKRALHGLWHPLCQRSWHSVRHWLDLPYWLQCRNYFIQLVVSWMWWKWRVLQVLPWLHASRMQDIRAWGSTTRMAMTWTRRRARPNSVRRWRTPIRDWLGFHCHVPDSPRYRTWRLGQSFSG